MAGASQSQILDKAAFPVAPCLFKRLKSQNRKDSRFTATLPTAWHMWAHRESGWMT